MSSSLYVVKDTGDIAGGLLGTVCAGVGHLGSGWGELGVIGVGEPLGQYQPLLKDIKLHITIAVNSQVISEGKTISFKFNNQISIISWADVTYKYTGADMKYYKYSDLDGDVILSRDEVLAEYWDYWTAQMSFKYGADSYLITEDNCIKDYMVQHWAEGVDDEC